MFDYEKSANHIFDELAFHFDNLYHDTNFFVYWLYIFLLCGAIFSEARKRRKLNKRR